MANPHKVLLKEGQEYKADTLCHSYEMTDGEMDKVKCVTFSSVTKKTIAACLIGVMLAGGSIYSYDYRNLGYAIKYQGKLLGYIRDKGSALEVFDSIKEELKKYDESIEISENIEFEKLYVNKNKLSDEKNIDESIRSSLYIQYTTYAIIINNKEVAIVGSKDESNRVIEGIKKHFEEEDIKNGASVLNVNIKDDIKVAERITNRSRVVDPDYVINMLLTGKGEAQKYEIKQGDSLWRIASKNNVGIEDIIAVNPGLKAESLQEGQVINLSVIEPSINVETTVKAACDEEVPYNTKYVDDGNLYSGDTKVMEPGQNGINRVEKQITKLNGKEVASAIVSAAVIKQPVTRVLARGTKILLGSGRVLWPVKGEVCSYFGSRGGQHKGIDIIADMGDPIYAADGGTVAFAAYGWNGGYGNKIVISHGNGYTTLYAHCSSLSVKEGQTVSKGQIIGNIGSTGDSIGPHLHFEVRLNDMPQNPLRFLK